VVGERGVEMELFPHLLIRSWGVGIGHSSSPNSLDVVADVVWQAGQCNNTRLFSKWKFIL